MADVFQNSTKSLPKKNPRITTVNLGENSEMDLAGRKSNFPKENRAGTQAIEHVGRSEK